MVLYISINFKLNNKLFQIFFNVKPFIVNNNKLEIISNLKDIFFPEAFKKIK